MFKRERKRKREMKQKMMNNDENVSQRCKSKKKK